MLISLNLSDFKNLKFKSKFKWDWDILRKSEMIWLCFLKDIRLKLKILHITTKEQANYSIILTRIVTNLERYFTYLGRFSEDFLSSCYCIFCKLKAMII